MAIGALIFFIGLAVLVRQGFKKKQNYPILKKKNLEPGRFAATATVAGVSMIMVSIYIQKLFPVESAQTQVTQAAISSNLKYELEAILPNDESNVKITKAINRFQEEYHGALKTRRQEHNRTIDPRNDVSDQN